MHLNDSEYGVLQGLTYFARTLDFLFSLIKIFLIFLLIVNSAP